MKNLFRNAGFLIPGLLIASSSLAFISKDSAFICQNYSKYLNCDCAGNNFWVSFVVPVNYSGSIINIEMNNYYPLPPVLPCTHLDFYGPYSSPQFTTTLSNPCYSFTPTTASPILLKTADMTSCTNGGVLVGGYYYCKLTLTLILDLNIYYLLPNSCVPCPDCLPSFSPKPDSTYIISAWVKQDNFSPTTTTYDGQSRLSVAFDGNSSTDYFASGQIIDGWQRIEGTFTVPHNASEFRLIVTPWSTSWFDDIRIYPKNGSMKTYVFDPVTLRLDAELDERNYATIYEYDEEGHLIRVKKETERGIMTIQENKTATAK